MGGNTEIVDNQGRQASKDAGKKNHVGMFSYIGQLFRQMLGRIASVLTITPKPIVKTRKKRRTPRKLVGLFSILNVAGRASKFLIKAVWEYLIKPTIVSPGKGAVKVDVASEHKLNREKQKVQQNEPICPSIRLIGSKRNETNPKEAQYLPEKPERDRMNSQKHQKRDESTIRTDTLTPKEIGNDRKVNQRKIKL